MILDWEIRQIARRTGVSHDTVRRYREGRLVSDWARRRIEGELKRDDLEERINRATRGQ